MMNSVRKNNFSIDVKVNSLNKGYYLVIKKNLYSPIRKKDKTLISGQKP